MMAKIDVLIPTFQRKSALAVTLTSLALQTWRDFRVIISDQNDSFEVAELEEVQAVANLLQSHGNQIEIHKHLPRAGMAEQRQFLFDQVKAPYALFIDDDLILETYVLHNMVSAIEEEGCGFVGSAVIGLSYLNDHRPHEQNIEFWEGPVKPETVLPNTPKWERYRLHNAANLYHVEKQIGIRPNQPRKYRVAWVGGCVLYDTAKLCQAGGFSFWPDLPADHCGEDVLAQLRVMARFGGCGLIPSGVYHQELPTTVEDRNANAPEILDLQVLEQENICKYG